MRIGPVEPVNPTQAQQVLAPPLNLFNAMFWCHSWLRILEPSDKCRRCADAWSGGGYLQMTTRLSITVHVPSVVRDVQIDRGNKPFVKRVRNKGGQQHFPRFSPERSFKPTRKDANKLLFDCAPTLAPATDYRTPRGPRDGQEINSRMAAIPAVFTGNKQLDDYQRRHWPPSLGKGEPPLDNRPVKISPGLRKK